jgi:HSP20 family protein
MANSSNARSSQLNVVPATDIFESEKNYLLALDVPGIDPGSVAVEMDKDILKVSGHREAEGQVQRYVRDFRVPSGIDAQAVSAGVKDGVLTVVLPKHERALPQRIPVTVH